jgi:alkanesulfonate monooxygenase SsuD/methylene tetrahydromethanopterin reductase-like flavin-dependent oxidoreductase (luciferase family)
LRAVRYGLCLANIGTYSDPRTVVSLAEEAELAGWEALLVWDHLGFVWGPPAADPWVTLAAVAARTSSLVVGTNITPVPRRRPHVLAHQVATLDVLSGGRVVFAAGIGGIPSEFTSFGEDGEARVRAEMLDEGLELLRGLWSGERVDHHGRHYTADGVTLARRPLQEHLPIWIGGNSKPALRRAARHDGWAADTTNLEGMTLSPEDVIRSVETIRGLRVTDQPFDVVVMGHVERGDRDTPAAYADAGATWWLENVHDTRGHLEEMLALVRFGPPR